MTENPIELLVESLAEALEQTAFISLSPADAEPPAIDRAYIVSIDVGDSARLHLAAPQEFGSAVACSILALDPGPEADEKSRDALMEVINVTCGIYITKVASSLHSPTPTMGLPTACFIESASEMNHWLRSKLARIVQAEGFPMAIAIEGRL